MREKRNGSTNLVVVVVVVVKSSKVRLNEGNRTDKTEQ